MTVHNFVRYDSFIKLLNIYLIIRQA